MDMVRNIAATAVLVACIGCASSTQHNPPSSAPDQPVGTSGSVSEPTQVKGDEPGRIPVGQLMDVRLQSGLSSATATREQRFEATTAVDLMQDGRVLIPAGSVVRGIVSNVDKAGNIDRVGRLTLAFVLIEVNGREYPLRAMATEVYESRGILEEGKTVGTAGAVGAIVGGIIGGVKGALIGAAVGTGGVIAATEGKDIDLPPGTIVRLRLDSPLELRRR
jgi:hypothetical protein